jgi:hypothetical protein
MAEGFSVTLLDSPGQGVKVEWDVAALGAIAEASSDSPPAPAWDLVSEIPDWERWGALRIVSAAFEDGRMLALAALRPAGAAGHGEEMVGGVIVRDGEPAPFDQVLLSTQYGENGEISHVNVEAFEGEDSVPVRAAGDRLASSSGSDEAAALAVTVLAMRMDGQSGLGTIDVMGPA